MKFELQKKIYDRFKFISPETLYVDGYISCGDGWFDLIWNLCLDLEKAGFDGKVVQIKEKYAGLHYYITGASEECYKLIDEAEHKSETICEKCGKPGHIHGNSWIFTSCDDCLEK